MFNTEPHRTLVRKQETLGVKLVSCMSCSDSSHVLTTVICLVEDVGDLDIA